MRILIVALLSVASWAQNTVVVIPRDGGVIPPPDIAHEAGEIAKAPARAESQAAQTGLIRQQTKLLQQQTEALKQQNALLKQQRESVLAAQAPKPLIASPELRKPRIEEIDAATGKPRFATLAEYLDARDEWLIAETLRRFEALHPTH